MPYVGSLLVAASRGAATAAAASQQRGPQFNSQLEAFLVAQTRIWAPSGKSETQRSGFSASDRHKKTLLLCRFCYVKSQLKPNISAAVAPSLHPPTPSDHTGGGEAVPVRFTSPPKARLTGEFPLNPIPPLASVAAA